MNLLQRNSIEKKRFHAEQKAFFLEHYLKYLHAETSEAEELQMIELKKIHEISGLPLNALIPGHIKPQNQKEINKKKGFKKVFNTKTKTQVVPLKTQMEKKSNHIIVGAQVFA